MFIVIWQENGKKREAAFMLQSTAVVFLRGLIIDCQIYNGRIIKRRY